MNDGGFINERAVVIEFAGREWALGGQWSEPGYARKPSGLRSLAETRGYDPDQTLAAYLAEEGQVGWYPFAEADQRPKRVPPLAQLVVQQVNRRPAPQIELPFTGQFNLGDCEWLIILDANGHILPGFEVWGTADDIEAFLDDDEIAGRVNSFRATSIKIDDPEEAKAWLMEGVSNSIIFAEPLKPPANPVLQVALAGVGLLVLVLLVIHVKDVIHAHQLAAARERLMEERRESSERALQMQMAKRMAENELNERLADYWANYPRAWAGAASPETILATCHRSIDADLPDVEGWNRTKATCRPNDQTLTFTELWKRGALATVYDMPAGGVFDPTGQVVTSGRVIPYEHRGVQPVSFMGSTGSPDDALRSAQEENLEWVGDGQKYGDEISVRLSPMAAFRPPVPAFVPQRDEKAVEEETPVLWEQEAVTIKSSLAPWDGWPHLSSTTFVVTSLSAEYTPSGIEWTMIGEQYAR